MTRLAREALLRRTMTKTKEGRTSHKRSHICGVKESQSDFHCAEMRTAGAGKDEKACSNVRRRWSNTKKIDTELISGDDFHRKTDAEIGERQELGWQMIRRRRRSKTEKGQGTVDPSSREGDSDSPEADVIRCDSLCGVVERRKRQRTDVKKTNGKREAGTPGGRHDH